MNIIPRIQVRRGDVVGNQVVITLPDLSEYKKTYLSADEAAGQTTISVQDGASFAANEYVVIEKPGTQEAEIHRVSSSTASTVVLATSTSYAHPRGTIVRFIPFNQVSIEDDTDSAFGTATTDTVDIQVEQPFHVYEDTDGTAATYYRVRFYHSNQAVYSQYSDGVIATGFADNTVYSVKKRALQSVGHKVGDFEWLTDDWLNNVIYEGRRELESHLDRWSFRKKFETDIATVQMGQNTISVPSDLREPETSKNLTAVYIGKNRDPLMRVTKQEMNEWYRDVAHTTLSGAAADTDTSLSLTDSSDFTDSGSVDVAGAPATATITGSITPDGTTTVTGVGTAFTDEIDVGDILIVNAEYRTVTAIASATSLTTGAAFTAGAQDASPDLLKISVDNVDYTDNDRTNNTLFGVTNIHTGGHSSGADVWQGVDMGTPELFTVTEDGILFSQPFEADIHGESIYADYWTGVTTINSDADTFDEPDYDMFVNYIAFRIKKRKAKGDISLQSDDDYQQYVLRSQRLITRERHEQSVHFIPDIGHLDDE